MSSFVRASFLSCALLPGILTAQVASQRDAVPLKHWEAPLYWQPPVSSAGRVAAEASANIPGSASPLVFVAITPCRLADTRPTAQSGANYPNGFGPPSLVANATRTFAIQSVSALCGIPSVAQAYSFAVTAVNAAALGVITMFPTGQTLPFAATLIFPATVPTLGAAIVAAGSNGSVDVWTNTATDLVIDVNGYYAAITNGPNNSNVTLGAGALGSNTSGVNNTASGNSALASNTAGSANTANGFDALSSNTTGGDNTAIGQIALLNNTTGDNNTAAGNAVLASNTSGLGNTGIGSMALSSNTTGNANVAVGENALARNVSGISNIAIGLLAGNSLGPGGNDNIDIGNQGSANDAGVIRIGDIQTSFFVAGVRGATTGANNAIPVVIDSNGQLGTISSSIRFKEDVHDMADASSGLLRLRPVTYRYKKPFEDGSKPLDYGLIAEEVAQVYPDLVANGADGRIETVQYQKLTPMLLNELQKQHAELDRQTEANRRLRETVAQQQNWNRRLEERLAALEELMNRFAPAPQQ